MPVSWCLLVLILSFFVLSACAIFTKRHIRTSFKIPFATFFLEADDRNDSSFLRSCDVAHDAAAVPLAVTEGADVEGVKAPKAITP